MGNSWFQLISKSQIVISHYPSISQNLPTQFSICREISASAVSFLLSLVIFHVVVIETSLTFNTYFVWFITKKKSVGGHVGRNARIHKSPPPHPFPQAKICQVRATAMNVKFTIPSILTNAGGCWYVRIQFKRRVFKSPAVPTSIFLTWI